MSAKDRLDRLKKIEMLAVRLQVALREERETAENQVAEIESSIAEGERRCQAAETSETWDESQPDVLICGDKAWRQPKSKDLGSMVRFGDDPTVNPETLEAHQLKGISYNSEERRKYFIHKGQVPSQEFYWPVAWVEVNKPIEPAGKVVRVCVIPEETKHSEEEPEVTPATQCDPFVCDLAQSTGVTCNPMECDIASGTRNPVIKEDLKTEHRFQVGDIVRRKQDRTMFSGLVGEVTGIEGDDILVKYKNHTWSNKSKAKNYELLERKLGYFCFESKTEPAPNANVPESPQARFKVGDRALLKCEIDQVSGDSILVRSVCGHFRGWTGADWVLLNAVPEQPSQFKVGDWVKLQKPKDLKSGWISPDMDVFDGVSCKVAELIHGVAKLEGCSGWLFPEEWLTKIDAPSEFK